MRERSGGSAGSACWHDTLLVHLRDECVSGIFEVGVLGVVWRDDEVGVLAVVGVHVWIVMKVEGVT
jgi:hypothetical protein